jgi:hypothetical protein
MQHTDHDPNGTRDPRNYVTPPKADKVEVWSYLVAAAILLPIGWWLKENYADEIGRFLLSPFGY